MTNPLNAAPRVASNSFADMAVGETRTVAFCGKPTRDAGHDMLVQTITRTARPLIYDWVDGSNERLAQTRPDLLWVVDGVGQAQLVSRKHYRGEHETR